MFRYSVAQLAGLASAQAVPWLGVLDLVDALMDFGRWLSVLVPEAVVLLNSAHEGWARTLLGADAWSNASSCTGELGWCMSGFGRVIRSVAVRQASCTYETLMTGMQHFLTCWAVGVWLVTQEQSCLKRT